ncbi:hypothetical protein [Natronoarchaeum rubrum]|uniref:hypothetical protein n=1 Tax=Natronoarchaeum rubrum TaxID=755311 RepID=UPI002110FFBA|nr:hypothetical protein [Natronoarchaeum rubrum]
MHRQIEWLTRADVTILEFLHAARDTRGNPAIQSPAIISDNTGLSRKHVGNRCRHLADHDLVEKVERGRYRLADKGERLMSGRIQPRDLNRNV